jgi:hypothetical protein
MKRIALLSALALVLATPLLSAQTPPPPVQKAKFVPPIKGQGTIDVIRTPAKRVGKELRTVLKVKNTSKGSINLLKVEQYWYDKSSKNVSFGEYRHKKAPILPGEVVEFVVVADDNPKISHDALIFGHAYGKLHAREVKRFE